MYNLENSKLMMTPVAGDWFKLEQRATGHVLDGGTVSHGGPG